MNTLKPAKSARPVDIKDVTSNLLYELLLELLINKDANEYAQVNKKNNYLLYCFFGKLSKECVPHTTIHMIHVELNVWYEKSMIAYDKLLMGKSQQLGRSSRTVF